MAYHGDIRLGDTIDIKFTTIDGSGAPTTLGGTPSVAAYVGNNTTEITAGITLSVDFDSRTGLNNVRSVATSGNGYATASNVKLVVTAGTVGGVSIVGYVVGSFSIENRSALMPATAGRTLVVDGAGLADANMVKAGPSGSGTAQTAGDIIGDTNDIQARLPAALVSGRIDASVGAMAAAVLTNAAIANNAINDAKVDPDVTIASVTGAVGSVTGSVGGNVAGSVGSVTGNVGGNVAGSVGSVAAGGITAASIASDAITAAKVADGTIDAATFAAGAINAAAIASDAITAAKIADGAIDAATFATGAITAAAIAADAIGASELAADAVAEIQSGLSTLTAAGVRSAVGLASANLDTQLGGIQADTDDIQTRLPAALVSGRMSSDAVAISGSTSAADAVEANIGNLDAAVSSRSTYAGGAVASVTGNVGGNVTGSVGSLATQAKADVNAEVDAALADVGVTTTVTGRIDAAISSRSSHSAADVWAVGTRTLTSFGSLVADVTAAVWAAASRTLTAFGFTVPATLSSSERNAIADAYLDRANAADGYTPRQAMRLGLAADAGETDGDGMATGTGDATVSAADGSKVRITATMDNNKRTGVTIDAS